MADLTLPNGYIHTLEHGDRGAAVYGIQRCLNRSELFPKGIRLDGIYGDKTQARVEKFQDRFELGVDGRFGPATSKRLASRLQEIAFRDRELPLPGGIIVSITELESGNLIAANNWSVAGGVDLSYVQRRVYEPYADDAIMRAFDGLYQFKLLGNTLRGRHDKYWTEANAVKTHEKAWRLAVLHHNYPYGADRIASVGESGLSSYWTTPQSWVTVHGRTFEDGAPVRTPLEWCQHYSLGAPAHNHEGVAVRQVSNWNVA